MLVPSSIYGIPNAKINDSRYCTYFFWHHAASKVDIFTACVRYCTRRPDASTMTLPVVCFCLLCVDLFRLAGQKVLLQQGPERQKKYSAIVARPCRSTETDTPPLKTGKFFFAFSEIRRKFNATYVISKLLVHLFIAIFSDPIAP